MEREIIRIDEENCTGCGLCVPNCHEGALQVIDGKVRLVSELMCDGLGACIGHCPEGAITIEKREAEPYDEIAVIKEMVHKGTNTVIAHLKHLRDHHEYGYLEEGSTWLEIHNNELAFDVAEVLDSVSGKSEKEYVPHAGHHHNGGSCPGSAERLIAPAPVFSATKAEAPSQLTHWPVQMHLVNPVSSAYSEADLLLAADCVAFSLGSFHSKFLRDKSLAIACPKLDHGTDIYVDKLIAMIDTARINTITVMVMEVPCCGGLIQLVRLALEKASRKVPVKKVMVSIDGKILYDEWI
jgi:NAD-dependent dihydropyrimidine dehydrogenase PreA subunit